MEYKMTAKGMGRNQRRIMHTREYGNWVRGCEVEIRCSAPHHKARDGGDAPARKKGDLVSPGDVLRDFRGQEWKLVQATRFRSPELGKTGKIVVADEFSREREYYDSVFDLEVTFK